MVSLRNKVAMLVALTFTVVISVSVFTKGFHPQHIKPITSNLPIVILRMDSQDPTSIGDDGKIAWMDLIDTESGINTFPHPYTPSAATAQYKIEIKLRGQTTRHCEKPPYSVKVLDPEVTTKNKKKDVSLFGWPEQPKYVLYSSCADASLLRNMLSFDLYKNMGHYASRAQYVEVFVVPTNTTDVIYPTHYFGVYVLMERIHHGKDWVDVHKMKEDDKSGNALTGGYMFKVDKGADGSDPVIGTKYATYTMIYPEDEAVTPTKVRYLSDYIRSYEQAIMSPDHTYNGVHYSELIDVESWVDMAIIQEVAKNLDAYRLSSYFYKDRKKKVVSGPAWDMDRTYGSAYWGLGAPTGFNMLLYNNTKYPDMTEIPKYWPSLLEDPYFNRVLKARYAELRNSTLSTDAVNARIDVLADELTPMGAFEREYNRWGPWYYPLEFWTTEDFWVHEARLIREWVETRLNWLDGAIKAL